MKTRNNVLKRGLALALALCLLLSLAACGKQSKDPSTQPTVGGEKVTHTVTVKSVAGVALPKVGICIYEDETQQELVWFDKTDDNGVMTFTDVERSTYVAVLSDVPTGYQVEESYPLTGLNTEILLAAGQMEDVEELKYKLGDMMMDFTVTDADGTEYQLSKLQQQKKAVVLNFWYAACGPCNAEFPFLQEAYEQYSEDVAVIAMNPVDDAAAVAAFRQEKGYTFPMVACDSQWEKIMQLTAYPTTVIIDRNGNIALIHKGGVDNTKTFTDAFGYFAAENYEQKLIADITELLTEEEAGTKSNPLQLVGQTQFEITAQAGQEVYAELYKATGMYMQIKGKNFKVLYNGKTYEPDSSGVVGFVITTGDTFTPANFSIVNLDAQKQTFQISLSHLPGTINNPYTLKLGEFDVKISAGNEQGVYYIYTAQESGTLTLQCLKNHNGVDYSFTLYNTGTMAVRTLEEDGTTDENGLPTVSVVVNKGDRVQFIASTLPDNSHNYPGGNFRYLASFEAGEGTNQDKVELVNYVINVTDGDGQPMVNVNFSVELEEETKNFSSDTEGVAIIALPKGSYTVKMIVPDGYTAENTEFALTEEAPTASTQLRKVVINYVDYTVTVLNPDGVPVIGVAVFIGEDMFAETDENGVAKVTLPEGVYTVEIPEVPEGFMPEEELFSFPEGENALTVTLRVAETEDPEPTEPEPTEPEPTEPEPTEPEPTEPEPTEPEPTEPEPTEPEPTEPEPTEPEPTEPEPTEPTEPTEPELPAKMDYSVTVLDPTGLPMQDVRVSIKQGRATKASGKTDANGNFTKNIATGEYTVELKFSSGSYYYDQSDLTVTGYKPSLTIRLTAEPNSEDVDNLAVLNGGKAYRIYTGATHVSLSTGKSYYSAANDGNCFYIFAPQEAGTYTITLSNNALKLSGWGTSAYQYHNTEAVDASNMMTVTIQEGQVGHVDFVIGIQVVEGITDASVICTRIGEPGFDISLQPWSTDWQSDYVPAAFTLNLSAGQKLTYVDLTKPTDAYTVVYNETDGFYHLGSENGPVLYVNLGKNAPHLSIYTMIRGDGAAGGAPLRSYFFDENDVFIKKEDYTDCMNSYLSCIDADTGVYPLTKDLAYMIQNGGQNWYKADSPTFIFKDADGNNDMTVNPEIAWMFAVCYVE